MLAQIGSVSFELLPLNIDGVSHEAAGDYAEKPVMGRRPPLEWVGEGPETYSLRGKLFPQKFGGLDEMEALHSMRRAGLAQPFMRGDGLALGWYVIDKLSEQSSYLDPQGIGRVIEFSASLKRSDGVGGDSVYSIVAGLIL